MRRKASKGGKEGVREASGGKVGSKGRGEKSLRKEGRKRGINRVKKSDGKCILFEPDFGY
jgi:hypothetical protein